MYSATPVWMRGAIPCVRYVCRRPSNQPFMLYTTGIHTSELTDLTDAGSCLRWTEGKKL